MAQKERSSERSLDQRIWKIENLVFDKRSIFALTKAIKKGILDYVDFPISAGKESLVLRGTTKHGYVAVKIYKIETSAFVHKQDYLVGDRRFGRVRNTPAEIAYAFASKEFKNLAIAEKAGIHAPRPYYHEKNTIIMSFIGENGLPYPKMNQATHLLRQEHYHAIIDDVKRLYGAGLVHSDLSEFNILIGDIPYLIDFSQGVLLSHPNAENFLERDILHLTKFFAKHTGLKTDSQKVLKEIRK